MNGKVDEADESDDGEEAEGLVAGCLELLLRWQPLVPQMAPGLQQLVWVEQGNEDRCWGQLEACAV